MQNRCPYCGATLHKKGAEDPAKCWMCTAPLDPAAARPKINDSPTVILRPPMPRSRAAALRLDENVSPQTQALVLPRNSVIKLAVVSGQNPGSVYDLSRPLMTVGRRGGGADIEIDDPEVSRLHCSIEVRRDAILLQDLRSKNGTFIDGARVFAARLEETSEFQVGATILRVDCATI